MDLVEQIKTLLEHWNVPENTRNIIIITIILLALIAVVLQAIRKLFSWYLARRKQRILNTSLKNKYFQKNDGIKYTKYYTGTKYHSDHAFYTQSYDERTLLGFPRKDLVRYLINSFNNNHSGTKYFLILGDAGAGKTTFLINLLVQYKTGGLRSMLYPKKNIVLFPLGAGYDVIKPIQEITDKENTILLLDALDEYAQKDKGYLAYLKEILDNAKDFSEVVITCRLQFFNSEEEELDALQHTTYGMDPDNHFKKCYILPFNDKDIKKYLTKRFPRFHPAKRRKYKRALKIVRKSPHLMIRPMLLYYIDDLLQADHTYKFSSDIYAYLINKWIVRESLKPGINNKYKSRDHYQSLLYDLASKLAIDMYDRREERNGYFIHKDDLLLREMSKVAADLLKEETDEAKHEIQQHLTGKSLLTRFGDGNYQFAHKSFLEYFLAKELMQNEALFLRFKWEEQEVVKHFFYEFLSDRLSNSLALYRYDTKKLEVASSDPLKSDPARIGRIQEIYLTRELSYFPPLYLKAFPQLHLVVFLSGMLRRLHTFYYLIQLGKEELLVQHIRLSEIFKTPEYKKFTNIIKALYLQTTATQSDDLSISDLIKDRQEQVEIICTQQEWQEYEESMYNNSERMLAHVNIRKRERIIRKKNLLKLLNRFDLLINTPAGRLLFSKEHADRSVSALKDFEIMIERMKKGDEQLMHELNALETRLGEILHLQSVAPHMQILY